jgi:hypothetical protein
MVEPHTAFYTDVSEGFLDRPGVERGTMMGFPCLRAYGAFFASCDYKTGDLVVKLPRERVAGLIACGVGQPFAPAGRTFREWVTIDDRDEERWIALIGEALAFAEESRS